MTTQTWSRAWREASRDFWGHEEPSTHFTTSAGPLVAERIADLVREVGDRLGHPPDLTIIDIGCGEGRLLSLVRERCGELAERARWIGIDVRPLRAQGIEAVIAEVPADLADVPVRGVVMAHEWLDEIPCDVVERDGAGVDRIVLVDREGTETLGPAIDDDQACAELGVDAREARSWLEQWWPLRETGDRAEVGASRDHAWAWMCGLVGAGTALATDYGHLGATRGSTLTGYRAGRLARPAPDGSINLTAHVALDACVAAVPGTALTYQRHELPAVTIGNSPTAADVELHFASLRLRDPARLGGVGWLRRDV